VLDINIDGHKELLGIWVSENEGAKFCLSVLTDLQNRGVQRLLIVCVDGLKGFPDAINATYAYAVYPPNRHLPLKVRSLIDFLVERFGDNPYWDQY